MGALTDDGVYGDVLALDNLSRVSSATFAGGWWYRTSFNITPDQNHARTRLAFDGINYRADIWLNGVKIASKNDIFGSFRRFELDITGKVKDGENILAAEVFPPQKGEPTIGFVDWNPAAPDKNMGIDGIVERMKTKPDKEEDWLAAYMLTSPFMVSAPAEPAASLKDSGEETVMVLSAAMMPEEEAEAEAAPEPVRVTAPEAVTARASEV